MLTDPFSFMWAWWAGAALLTAGVVWGASRVFRVRAAAAAVLACGFSACGCGADDAGPSAASAAPRLAVDVETFDFGRVLSGEGSYDTTFTIANRGNLRLEIHDVVSGCGCTAAVPGRRVVPPGESTELAVTVTPRPAERRRVLVQVVTNDPAAPRTDLSVAWESASPRTFDPPSVDFGRVRPGQVVERKVSLRTTPVLGRNGLPAAAGETGPPRASESLSVKGDEGSGAYTVTLRAPAPTGPGRGEVRVPLSGGSSDALVLPVRWSVAEAITLTPTRLLLRPAETGAAVGVCVLISDRPAIVAAAELRGVEGRVEFHGEPRDRIPLRVVAEPADGGGHVAATLAVTLSSPVQLTLTAPVVVLGRPDGSAGGTWREPTR